MQQFFKENSLTMLIDIIHLVFTAKSAQTINRDIIYINWYSR